MPRPQRGDYTGRERQRLMEENAKELEKRQQEIGMAAAADIVVEQEGIYDPASGGLLEMPPESQAKLDALSAPIEVEDEDAILDPAQPPPKYDPMKDLRDLETKQVTKTLAPNSLEIEDLGEEPFTVEDEWRVIRVNTDIEEMTYGVGNVLTFLRGRRYRVPRDLANWLESRGVIYH